MQAIGLSAAFEAACRQYRDRVATWQVDGAPVSFASYFATMIAFAERLAAEGIGPGSRVSVAMTDGIAGRLLTLALLRLGATALPDMAAHPDLPVDLRLVQGPHPGIAGRELLVTADWIRTPARLVPIALGGQLVKSTSGTTGVPKLRLIDDIGLGWRLARSSDMRGAASGPVFNGYNPAASTGFATGLRAVLAGQAHLNQPARPEEWLAAIRQLRLQLVCLPPASFARLLEAAETFGTEGLVIAEIRVGGGQLPPAMAERGEALFGCPVLNTYGSNETGSIAHHRPALSAGEPGIVGEVYPDLDLRFRDEAGRPVDPATGGALSVRLPRALWVCDYPSGQPLCDAEGWQDTGDIARLLPGGRLQLLGRVSDVLNIGGNKIAPVRVEALAAGFPGLREVAAFAAPGPGGLDLVGLAVVADEGFDSSAFLGHIGGHLGRQFPLVLRLMSRLPATAAGKIDRARLTQDFRPD